VFLRRGTQPLVTVYFAFTAADAGLYVPENEAVFGQSEAVLGNTKAVSRKTGAVSRKTGAVSRKTEDVSRKTGVTSTDITPMFTVLAFVQACIPSDNRFIY